MSCGSICSTDGNLQMGIVLLAQSHQSPRFSNIADGDDHRLQGFRVDVEIFNGAAVGTHAVFDTATFKGGSGRTGRTDHPFLVADNDFAIGADIDNQLNLIAFIGRFRSENSDIVGTHKSGFVGQNMNVCRRAHVEP